MAASAPSIYNLYVTPVRTPTYNPSLLDGSLTQPFEDLEDAFEKAMEKCALFKTCNVFIYLIKGDHYLPRKAWNFYKPNKVSRDQ